MLSSTYVERLHPIRACLALLAVTALLLALAAPAASHPGEHSSSDGDGTGEHLEQPREGLELVGAHALHGDGWNTDVWTQVTDDGRLFGYVGTYGLPAALTDADDPCPSEDDNRSDPQKSGVKIVDATDPANPEMVGAIGQEPGSQSNDVKVERLSTADFDGHLLSHSLEPCGWIGIQAYLVGFPVSEFPLPQTGFELYDVSEPTEPAHLGTWNNGGLGTHNLFIYQQDDRAFVAAVYNEISEFVPGNMRGVLQIVEVTDPTSPTLVAEWELADAVEETGQEIDEICQPRGVDSTFCYLHDVWVEPTPDGRWIAYLSYWDAGLILLDVGDPEEPEFIGQFLDNPTEEGTYLDAEGNTHVAVPYHVDGRHLVIVGDEDFTGPGPAPYVTLDVFPDGAEVAEGDNLTASEMTDTRPLEEGAVGPLPVLLPDDAALDASGCSFLQAAAVAGGSDWIAIARRGGNCGPFTMKVQAAEQAGASGLIIVNTESGSTSGLAAGGIPAVMIDRDEGSALFEAIDMSDPDAVQVTLQLLEAELNPWGFMRVFDVTDLGDPSSWREVSTFKAPHVDTFEQPGGTFTAHNPLIGPDGRVYFSWYTNGVRVLEPGVLTGEFDEVAWFVPLGDEHPDFPEEDPRGRFGTDPGFWGSQAVEHPETGEILVFNSDINNGLYILGYGQPVDAPTDETAAPATLPATGGGVALIGALLLVGLALVRRRV